jgi:peptidyl-prolyl cis-trans isomerase SurA
LIKPKTAPDDELKTKLRLDSLITLIKNDSISFDKAALYYSQDEDSKLSGGIVVNPETETTKFEMDQLNRPEYNVIRNMKEGEMSEIIKSIDKQGRLVFKVIKLKSRTKPHKANMDTDLNIIKQMALTHKQQKIIDNWIDEKIKTTYIHIDDKYKACKFIHNWNK